MRLTLECDSRARTAILSPYVFGVAVVGISISSCDGLAPTLSEPDGEGGSEVVFADESLAERVRQVLGITHGGVTPADMERLVALNHVNGGIEDLTGLEHAVNLEQLYLPDNEIRDLAPLRGLSRLQRLNLSGNAISDLSPVETLVGLEHLDLDHNEVSDLAALSELGWLTRLELEGNRINQVSALREIVSLEFLYLANNQLADAGPLSALTGLRVLDLAGNRIGDASPFGGPVAPLVLLLDDNDVTDLSALVANDGLANGPSHVSVRGNPLSDEARCDHIPGLQDVGVIVRGADGCPSGSGEEAPSAITTDRDVYVSKRQAIHASFTNRGDVTLYGNKCSNTVEWEFQLQIERLVEDEWQVVHHPVSLTCLNPQEIQPGARVLFKPFPVGAETGTYRLVWARVYSDEEHQSHPPLGERVSEPFSIVDP